MLVLGIETSCDETSAAVVSDGTIIISNVVSSQIDIHARYGGVVPEVASRQHILTIIPVIRKAMGEAGVTWHDIDAIAVTRGPGLSGSLLVGVNAAKGIALAHNLPLIGINHLEGHIYANWLTGQEPLFPCLCLIASGGHSDLIVMRGHGQLIKIGKTRDDAAGEAFDKGARILGLGYPGGPVIEQEAKKGSPSLRLPRAWLRNTDDFSFSGVKTALLHLLQSRSNIDGSFIADAASSFQEAIVDVLVTKTVRAAQRLEATQIVVSGGVAANKALRDRFLQDSPLPVLIPPPHLCTDNAAMIAACGYYQLQQKKSNGYEIDVIPSLTIEGG
jgi:N6-L-threonylcarbamoyladenine synthase